jgi:hypothetical protein
MSKTLRFGSKGAAVVAIQRELQKRVAADLAINGHFDKATEDAVRLFQQAAGFEGKDVDGIVGPKTTLAIFQTFDMYLKVKLTPDLKRPEIPSLPNPSRYSPSGTPAASPTKANQGAPPKLRQLNLQFGLTFRAGKPYFPHSDKFKFYHGAHAEIIPQLSIGFPVVEGGIFTGQLTVTIQPLTDWLVIGDRWHLFTPAFGFYGQIPLNSGPASDPATHKRAGGYVGAELFHFDIFPDRLAIGVSGQEAFYWDSKSKNAFADLSVMGFLQGTIKEW